MKYLCSRYNVCTKNIMEGPRQYEDFSDRETVPEIAGKVRGEMYAELLDEMVSGMEEGGDIKPIASPGEIEALEAGEKIDRTPYLSDVLARLAAEKDLSEDEREELEGLIFN